jgi:hypothetical protein
LFADPASLNTCSAETWWLLLMDGDYRVNVSAQLDGWHPDLLVALFIPVSLDVYKNIVSAAAPWLAQDEC